MARHVLDASAVLAWLQGEPGAAVVDPLFAEAAISTVNWSEILQKVAQKGRDAGETGDLLKALGLQIVPLTEEDASLAASLWSQVSNLSLADRCCLALAHRRKARAVTADSRWQELPMGLEILVIR
jgi:ribonuclease VapC